jgi:hypothetical protein
MVNTAEQTARNAEALDANVVGTCLMWCRERAGIPALYGTAAIAAAHAQRIHRDLDVPRGAFAFWTGGSDGAGHIAIGLGNGVVRSTDAGGPGRVATKPVEWFATNWHLTYVGWADNVNGVTVPGVGDDMADPATQQKLDDILTEIRETHAAIATALDALADQIQTRAGKDQLRKVKQLLRDHDTEEATP